MPVARTTSGIGTQPVTATPSVVAPTVARRGNEWGPGPRRTYAPPSGAPTAYWAGAVGSGAAGLRSTAAVSVVSGPELGGASAGGPP